MNTEIVQDTGYGLIPKRIMRNKSLSLQAKAIYSYLASFAGNTGQAFPSVNLIIGELGISRDTFYKYMNELKDKEAIEIKKVRSKGQFTRNVYVLNNQINTPCPKSSDTVKSDTALSDTVNQDTISNSLKSNNIISNSKEYSTFFEKMWKLYPNKKGKGQVSKSKKKEIYKIGEEFERCISRYKKYVENERKNGFEDLKYQNGSTFFNSGYVDYLDENYKDIEKKEEDENNPYTGWDVY